MKRFWQLLKPDQRDIKIIYFYALIHGLVSLSLPLGIQAIVNLIQGGSISTSWVVLVIIVVLGIAIIGVFQIFQLVISEQLQQKIFTRAAFEFTFRMPRIKWSELYGNYAPELMNRFFDIISVQKGLSKIIIDFSVAGFQVIFGLILLALYHSFFIIIALILILLVYVIIQFTAKAGLSTSLEESKHKYQVAHWLEELARNAVSFKLFSTCGLPLKQTDLYVSQYLHARKDHFKILYRKYILLIIFKVIVATCLLAIGGVLVMEQRMNIGQFIAAEIIILLVLNSTEKLVFSIENLYDVLTALEKIGQVTDLELEEQPKDQQTISNKFSVEVNQVSFSFPHTSKKVISNFSFNLQEGEHYRLAGTNELGREILVHLLARLYTTNEGYIIMNGAPIQTIPNEILSRQLGVLLPQEKLFEGTIIDNITMGQKVTTEDIEWAITNLCLTKNIDALPEGLYTKVQTEGQHLPRSLTQKILLARTIIHRPKLLLMIAPFRFISQEDTKEIIDFIHGQQWSMLIDSQQEFVNKCFPNELILND